MTYTTSLNRHLAHVTAGALSAVALLCATTAVANADPVFHLDVAYSNGSHGDQLTIGQTLTVTAQMTGDGTAWSQGCYIADLFLLQGSGWRVAGSGTSTNGSTQIEHVDGHGVVDIPADSTTGGWPPSVWHTNHNGAANGTITDQLMPGNTGDLTYVPGDYTLAASCLPENAGPFLNNQTYAAVGPVVHFATFEGATDVGALNSDGNATPGSTVTLNTHASGPSVLGTCDNPTLEVVGGGNWRNTLEPRIYDPSWRGDFPNANVRDGRAFYEGGVGAGAGTTFPQSSTNRFVPSKNTPVPYGSVPPYEQPANGGLTTTPWYATTRYAPTPTGWLGYPHAVSSSTAQVSLSVPGDGSWGEGPFTVVGSCGIGTADNESAGDVTTVSAPFYIRAVTPPPPPTTTPPATTPVPPATTPPLSVPPTSAPPAMTPPATPPTTWVSPPRIPYTG